MGHPIVWHILTIYIYICVCVCVRARARVGLRAQITY